MRHAFIGVVVRSLPLLAVLVVHVSSSLPLCRCNTSFNWNTLMTVYDALNGSQWVNVDGTHNVTVRWDSGNGSTVCDWYGVTCDNSTGNITGISFPSIRYLDVNNHWGCYDLGLAGTLPSAIGGLSESLTVLKFCGQIGVSGTVPRSWASLWRLEYYVLSYMSRMSPTPIDNIVSEGMQSLVKLSLIMQRTNGVIPNWGRCPAVLQGYSVTSGDQHALEWWCQSFANLVAKFFELHWRCCNVCCRNCTPGNSSGAANQSGHLAAVPSMQRKSKWPPRGHSFVVSDQ